MTDSTNPADSMEFLRKMWGNMGIPIPGMVVPTLDTEELAKKIVNLKTVEGWLKMNLNMLQLHIQGLEMQCNTLQTMQNLGQGIEVGTANPFAQSAMWPWNVMQQAAEAAAAANSDSATKTTDNDKKNSSKD